MASYKSREGADSWDFLGTNTAYPLREKESNFSIAPSTAPLKSDAKEHHFDPASDTEVEDRQHFSMNEILRQNNAQAHDLELAATPPGKEDDQEYPHGMKLFLLILSIYLALFLVALDRTIIATAVPTITNQFNSLSDQGWYVSAYLLGTCTTQLIFGRIYKFYSSKVIFLIAIGLFELGSLLCGVAPNSDAFIVGRTIAGVGSAGIFSGNIVLLMDIVPLHKRAMYTGLMGAIFGVASVIGPLLGGVFTDKVTWRWCFYINLPIGGFTAVVLLAILKPRKVASSLTLREQLRNLDPWGTLCFIPGVICFLLALQWGGTAYEWSNVRIIVLFVLAGLLIICFIGVQLWKQEMATIPPRIISNSSVCQGALFTFFIGGSMISLVFYLPLWFQAIKDVSAVQSGINTLPFILALVVSSILSGIFITKTGWYNPCIIFCPVVMSIGAGFITTFNSTTAGATWIGWQIMYGFGLGCGMQQASLAVQAALDKADVSIGVSLMFFTQALGGAVLTSVSQAIFTNEFTAGLVKLGVNPTTILNTGATNLRKVIPTADFDAVIALYNDAIMHGPIYVCVALACVAVIPAVLLPWKNVKGLKNGGSAPAE